MRIYFQHNWGLVETFDFQSSMIFATDVEVGEEEAALNGGFLLKATNSKPEVWYNTRSTRVRPQPFPVEMTFEVRETCWNEDVHLPIYSSFVARKQFKSIDEDLIYLPERDIIIEYLRSGIIVGFSKVRLYAESVELTLHANLSPDVSRITLDYEIARFADRPHVYLGPGYQSSSIYKGHLPGFEWWTGAEWSRDVRAYIAACKGDDAMQERLRGSS